MDEKIKELIAIGASITGHCQPCLKYHIEQALKLGVSAEEINIAISVGKIVEKGALKAMDNFAKEQIDMVEQIAQNNTKTVKVYDPPMCCSTGVCGINVDPKLVEFANTLKTLSDYGIVVERYNLAHEPKAFVENTKVKQLLDEKGQEGLPLIFINDELKWFGAIPPSSEILNALGIEIKSQEPENTCCCGDSGCC